MKIVTIGVYGFDEDSFCQALQSAGVDTFADIRQRRGVRGPEYAFANSAHLQERLAEMGIRYVHLKELAPPSELRSQQLAVDHEANLGQRSRQRLGEAFIQGYNESRLTEFDLPGFLREVGDSEVLCLFCVEREPEACHRSLLANHLAEQLGITVQHILPALH
jgi:uncharacterized protein (DUF488 family)